MRVLAIAVSTAVSIGLVLFVAWWFRMPLEKAIYFAPLIVLSFGAIAALIVLWTRIALDPILRRRRGEQA